MTLFWMYQQTDRREDRQRDSWRDNNTCWWWPTNSALDKILFCHRVTISAQAYWHNPIMNGMAGRLYQRWMTDTHIPFFLMWTGATRLLHSPHMVVTGHSTTICKLIDLIPALRQSDCRIPNWVNAKTVLSSSTNHGQTTARFRSFFW